MSAVYSTNNVVTNCKKNWKEIEKKVEISKNQKSFPFLTVRVVIESRKFPFLKCVSSNRAVNFFGNFGEISESFLKSE